MGIMKASAGMIALATDQIDTVIVLFTVTVIVTVTVIAIAIIIIIRSGSDPRQGKESSPLDQQRLSSARTLLDDVVVAVGGVFVIVITIVVVVATIIIEEEMDAFSCPLLTACPVELLIDSEAPGIRNTIPRCDYCIGYIYS